MYILITVTTLLMLLAIITSTRFEVFLTIMGIRNEYEKYMVEEERSYYNAIEKKKYVKQEAKPKRSTADEGGFGGGGGKSESKKVFPCSKLNVQPLFEEKIKSQAYFDFVRQVLVRLIEGTYAHRRFFRGLDPTAMVDGIIQGGKTAGCGGNPAETINDLAQIAFKDSTMREVYYLMIKGSGPEPEDSSQQPDYYPSLLDFLTFKSGEVPVRVYLARRTLLLALYANPEEVNRLIRARAELLLGDHPQYIVSSEGYDAASEADEDCENPPPAMSADDTATLQSAKQSFEAGAFSTPFDQKFFDYSVSATTPPND